MISKYLHIVKIKSLTAYIYSGKDTCSLPLFHIVLLCLHEPGKIKLASHQQAAKQVQVCYAVEIYHENYLQIILYCLSIKRAQ